VRELTFGRVISAFLTGAALAVVLGLFAYHALAATRAQDVPTSPAVAAAFADAGPEWIRHMDLPVRRLALKSAEEDGTGNYLPHLRRL
jgi:hypothetical protein